MPVLIRLTTVPLLSMSGFGQKRTFGRKGYPRLGTPTLTCGPIA